MILEETALAERIGLTTAEGRRELRKKIAKVRKVLRTDGPEAARREWTSLGLPELAGDEQVSDPRP